MGEVLSGCAVRAAAQLESEPHDPGVPYPGENPAVMEVRRWYSHTCKVELLDPDPVARVAMLLMEIDRLRAAMRAPSQALADVTAERQRQVSAEGWTPEHDDTHDLRELARAAEAYVSYYRQNVWRGEGNAYVDDRAAVDVADDVCYPEEWDFKPKNPRRDLVRAGALIVAEIERLDRAAAKG